MDAVEQSLTIEDLRRLCCILSSAPFVAYSRIPPFPEIRRMDTHSTGERSRARGPKYVYCTNRSSEQKANLHIVVDKENGTFYIILLPTLFLVICNT